MKNVAGYDLGKLVCGSMGKLALIARVSLRLHPAPGGCAHPRRRDGGHRRRRVDTPALAAAAERARRAPSRPRRPSLRGLGARSRRAGRHHSRARGRHEEADGSVWDEARERQAAALGSPPLRAARPAKHALDAAGGGGAALRGSGLRAATYERRAPTRRAASQRRDQGRRSTRRERSASMLRELTTRLRALRLLPADLPDLRPLARGDGLAARAHPADGEEARRHRHAQPARWWGTSTAASAAWRASRAALGRPVRPADRGDASRGRAGDAAARARSDCSVACSSRRCPTRGACAGRCGSPPSAAGCPRPAGRSRCSSSRRAGARATRPRASPRRPVMTRGRVGLLAGCVQRVLFGEVNAATARVLAAEGFEVIVPRQGCCGALSAHAGRLEESRSASPSRLSTALAGVDSIVVNASGCGSHLKDHDVPALDVTEALASLEQRATLHPLELTVAYQDSCHLRHAQRLPAAWRPLLARIPGLERRRARRAGPLLRLGRHLQRRPARGRARARRPQGRHTCSRPAPTCVASANPGCLVQVAQALGRAGKPLARPAPGGAARRVAAPGHGGRAARASRTALTTRFRRRYPPARDETGRHTAPAPHPGGGDRGRPGHVRPLRCATGHLRRLHRQRTRARLPRGRDPRGGAAAVCEHAHRVVGDGPADDAAARGRAAHHPRGSRRGRRHLRDLLRLRARRAPSTS